MMKSLKTGRYSKHQRRKERRSLDFRIYRKRRLSRVTYAAEISGLPVSPFTSHNAWRNGTRRMTNCRRLGEGRSRRSPMSYTYVSTQCILQYSLIHQNGCNSIIWGRYQQFPSHSPPTPSLWKNWHQIRNTCKHFIQYYKKVSHTLLFLPPHPSFYFILLLTHVIFFLTRDERLPFHDTSLSPVSSFILNSLSGSKSTCTRGESIRSNYARIYVRYMNP